MLFLGKGTVSATACLLRLQRASSVLCFCLFPFLLGLCCAYVQRAVPCPAWVGQRGCYLCFPQDRQLGSPHHLDGILFSFCLERLNVCLEILHASSPGRCMQRGALRFAISRLKCSQAACAQRLASWSHAARLRLCSVLVAGSFGWSEQGCCKHASRSSPVREVGQAAVPCSLGFVCRDHNDLLPPLLPASPPRLADGAGSPGGHARPSRPPDGAARPRPGLSSPCMGLASTAGQRSGTKGTSAASALQAAAQPLPRLLAREQTAALQPLPSLRAGRLPLSLTNVPTK